MMFVNQPMRLKYIVLNNVIDAGPTSFDEHWYDDWLNMMVNSRPANSIFFFTVETTDVFETAEEVRLACILCGVYDGDHSEDCPISVVAEGIFGENDDK